jgi:hypothetical protein
VLVAGHCIVKETIANNVCASERATSALSRITARIMACIALPFSLVPSTLGVQMEGALALPESYGKLEETAII